MPATLPGSADKAPLPIASPTVPPPAALVTLSPARYRERVDELLDVYAEALGVRDRDGRRQVMLRHAAYENFAAHAMLDERGAVLGFAYGYSGREGQWWHDQVAGVLRREVARDWLAADFEVAEVHVRPVAQRRGYGRALLAALLADAVGGTALLSVHLNNVGAQALYRELGFEVVAEPVLFGGALPAYAVLGRRLPVEPGTGREPVTG